MLVLDHSLQDRAVSDSMANSVGDEEPEKCHLCLVPTEVPDKGGDDKAEIKRAGHDER